MSPTGVIQIRGRFRFYSQSQAAAVRRRRGVAMATKTIKDLKPAKGGAIKGGATKTLTDKY